ncbi:MAG: HAMP domain-containing sensor histidine kinase [Lachnospiraceae bacterium]|nr:HAMP domain-containing sensor histidine kinase [Lachnospiraceae bacterium]
MRNKNNHLIKESLFPTSIFTTYLAVLLLMSGIHTGLIVFMNKMHWNEVIQSILPMIYWAIVAGGLTLFVRKKVKNTYEEPMLKLAKATKQVANGDFSVYVPVFHTADRLDYLDAMILDFNKMVEELGSIETLKTDFVSNVSHEMKTPIAIIKNYAELLKADNILDEQRKRYAISIEKASMRLSDLISNILKLNKLENQKIMPKSERYDVCRQLCNCVLQFEEQWSKKEIELEMETDDVAMIQADEHLMELVWNNLLSNAIKFTDPGGKIIIRQTFMDERIQISISDSGCGMSRESMNRIFDKFYQGDTSHSSEGNGLGLALVYRVLQLLDGDIQVISELEKGSTFTVTLPIEKQDGI